MGIGPAQAEHQSLDGFAFTALGHRTIAGERAETDRGDIGDSDHIAVLGLQNNGFDVIDRLDGPFGANQQCFFAVIQPAGAVVAIVGFEDGLQILQRQTARSQQLRVGYDFKGAHFTTQTVDVSDAGNRAQLRANHPVEQGTLVGERHVAFDGEHEHLAERCGDGCHAAGDAGGQVAHCRGEALADLLACPVDVGAVFEVERDVGQRIFRGGAQQALMRDAEQFLLDRHGEAGFDLFRRHARRLQDNLDLGGRYIGEGVNRQAEESLYTGPDQHDGKNQQQKPLGEREADQRGEHYSFPTPVSMAFSPETPLMATLSPALMPSTMTLSPPWLTTRTGRTSKVAPLSSLAT